MARSLTRREQKIFIVCLCVVFFCILYSRTWEPLQIKENSINEEINGLRRQLNKNRGLIKTAQGLDERYQAYVRQFYRAGSKEEIAALILSEIEEVISEHGLHVTELKPKKIEQHTYDQQFAVSLTINSKLLDIIGVLFVLQQQPYLFTITEIEFEKLLRPGQGMITSRIVLSKSVILPGLNIKDGNEKNNRGVFPEKFMPFKPEPFGIYAEGIQKRDLFQLIEDGSDTNTAALRKALPALQKRIKLLGILMDGDSKAIVEDIKEQKVHFLSKGERVGAVLLEDIQKDKAIFLYNNERIEMDL